MSSIIERLTQDAKKRADEQVELCKYCKHPVFDYKKMEQEDKDKPMYICTFKSDVIVQCSCTRHGAE